MMGVYINGMEMPTSCDDCPMGGSLCCHLLPGVPALWAEYTNAVREKRMHSDCPLFPVPQHGRLIDADALMDEAYQPGAYGYVDAIQIENAPTIIPAEEGE